MFGQIAPKMSAGLTRLRQRVESGLKMVIQGPENADIEIRGGINTRANVGSAGRAGSVTIAGGLPGGSNRSGGDVALIAGPAGPRVGLNNTIGGNIQILAGAAAGSVFSSGGAVTILAGNGADGGGGDVVIRAGDSTVGSAGTTTISGGQSQTPGALLLHGGDVTAGTGGGAAATVRGGAGTTNGGQLNVHGGTGATGGNVNVRPGSAVGNIQLDGGRGAAIATTATGGFVTVPTCAGAPTGTPINVPTGSVATVVDTTNLRIYAYISGSWRYVQLVT